VSAVGAGTTLRFSVPQADAQSTRTPESRNG